MKKPLAFAILSMFFLSLAYANAFEFCFDNALTAEMKAKAACDVSCIGECTCKSANYCISLQKGACDASCTANQNCIPCYQASECECNGLKISTRPFPFNACKQEAKCYNRTICSDKECEKESDVWLYDSCNGWLYELNDCSALNQQGQCGEWKCLIQGRIKTKKVKIRVDNEGYCNNAKCESRKVTRTCEEFECPYGCAESSAVANCYPKAVLKTIPAAKGNNVEINEGQSVVFDCSDSHDPDGSDITCKWDFGGSFATGTVVTKTFKKEGTYKVKLTVSDSQGLNDSEEVIVNVIVHNWAPDACFTVEPSEGIVGVTEFKFDASCSSDPNIGLGDYIESYVWDFGDGTIAEGVRTKHVYTKKPIKDEAIFKVKLIVKDKGFGQSLASMATKEITVKNNPPKATFSAEPKQGNAPLSVSFKVLEGDSDGHATSYEWNFGDGSTAIGTEMVHTYKELGEYAVTLNATDEYGASSTSSTTINVYSMQRITTTNAESVTKGGTTAIFVDCIGAESVNLTVSKGEKSTNISNVRCGTHIDYGPLDEEGTYNVIAQLSDCSKPECIKSTTFNVVARQLVKKSAPEMPEISPVIAIFTALAALLIAHRYSHQK